MAKIYYELIMKNLKTIIDVPLRWRAEVQAMFNSSTD
ncbi:CD1375 family protein [Paenibacillaceae bacterium WGS1546]